MSCASWLLFTGVPARCVALGVWCPGPLGSCSPVCPLGALLCVFGVLGHLAPVQRCARVVCCVACAVSWATWPSFTGVPALCVVLGVRCPGPLGSCSPVCTLRPLFCLCGVLGHLAPVHRCAARCVVLSVRCPGPLGSCSPVCTLRPLFCLCGVLGHLAPVHRCAARCVVLSVRCPGPLGSCSPVCTLRRLPCLCGVLGHLAPVHRCACSVCCVACAVSLATWLPFTGVRVPSFALPVRCPGPLGSCSPVCRLGVLCCVCGVLGHLAPVHRCARSVLCFACAVSWATWLLFTVCLLGALLCVCCVLGHLAPVHRCARWVCCVGCAVSWATWLLFTGMVPRCVVLWVACAVLRVRSVAAERTLRSSGRRLFVAGRGWVPSGRALVHPDGGCFGAGSARYAVGRALVRPDGGCL